MRKRDLMSAVAGAVVAAVFAGGVAWAAIPGAGGVINGCYQKVEGQLRVIDADTTSCRSPEVPIAWNAQGVQGVKGDKGDAGAAGRDGRDGVSATVEPEARGANCMAGGAKVTAAGGVTYVCNAVASPPPDAGGDD